MIPALLLVAALSNFAPALMAGVTGGSVKAWEYVFTGIESAALWWLAACLLERTQRWSMAGLCVCLYGMFESIQRPICRLVFPMDSAPNIGESSLCAAAGMQTFELSPMLIAICAFSLSVNLQKFVGAKTNNF